MPTQNPSKMGMIVALFIITQNANNSKSPSNDEWILKNVVCPYNEISFDHKKKWSTKDVTAWMSLWTHYVAERSQAKEQYCMISFIWNAQIGKSIEIESSLMVARGKRE